MIYTTDFIISQYSTIMEKYHSGQTCFGSAPKPMFINGFFNPDNWNSTQDIIRYGLAEIISPNLAIHIDDGCLSPNDPVRKYARSLGVTEIDVDIHIDGYIKYYEDEWYVSFNIICPEIQLYDNYVTKWYKDRGCTEMITKNGRAITLPEYVDFLTILSIHGAFIESNWNC